MLKQLRKCQVLADTYFFFFFLNKKIIFSSLHIIDSNTFNVLFAVLSGFLLRKVQQMKCYEYTNQDEYNSVCNVLNNKYSC